MDGEPLGPQGSRVTLVVCGGMPGAVDEDDSWEAHFVCFFLATLYIWQKDFCVADSWKRMRDALLPEGDLI